MSLVVVGVVPGSHARPQDIARAVAAAGHEPLFVAVAGTLDEPNTTAHAAFGEVIECDPDTVGDTLARLRSCRPVGITTFSEGMVRLTADLAAGLDLPYHDHATVTALTNKGTQRCRLAESGVGGARSVLVTSRGGALAELRGAVPAVIKPVTGQSSRDTYLIEDPDWLPADLEPSADSPFLVEEYLRGRPEKDFGDYVSVEMLVADGMPYLLGVTGKYPLLPPFREHGQFFPAHLPPHEAATVTDLAERAAGALGVRSGLLHTEVKLTAAGPRIIEVNGRIGGYLGDLYGRASGVDLLALGIKVACGQPVAPAPIRSDWVTFQYWNLPPTAGGVLRQVTGVEPVQRESGVDDYGLRVPVGGRIAPSVMTQLLDLLRGSAPDHDAMLTMIDSCFAHLRFTIEAPGGAVRTWQAARGEMCAID